MGKKNKHLKLPFMGNKTGPHPRNIYQAPPDIKQLAIQFPEFRPFVQNELNGKITINYKERKALYALVRLMLKKDFELDLNLPEDRLVPVLPLRLNYVLWIEDLLAMIPTPPKPVDVRGIDIGTGASCIYCLLAVRKCKWNMLATELDASNFEYAKHNVAVNDLEEKVSVKKVNEGTFLVGAVDEGVVYDFCMCNPPFYDTEEEFSVNNREKDRTGRRPQPKSVCTGASVELAAPGGEVAFISAIINDSKTLGQKVKIYTTMIGHRKSVDVIGEQLIDLVGRDNVVMTTFQQGHVTRWGVAWTFDGSIKLSKDSERQPNSKPAKAPVEYVRNNTTLEAAVQRVRFLLDRIQIVKTVLEKRSGVYAMELKGCEATWQNQRKRRREEERRLKDLKRVKLEESDSTVCSDIAVPLASEVETKNKGEAEKTPSSCESVATDTSTSSKLLLHAIITLKPSNGGQSVTVQMSPAATNCCWDSVYQLMTYLKNQWDRDLVELP